MGINTEYYSAFHLKYKRLLPTVIFALWHRNCKMILLRDYRNFQMLAEEALSHSRW